MLLVAALAGGCASLPKAGPDVGVIRFDMSPAFMGNDGWELTVASTGEGRLRHRFRDKADWRQWRQEDRAIHVAPEKVAAFAQAIEAYRPVGERNTGDCPQSSGDAAQLRVQWSGGGVAPSSLFHDMGCDDAAVRKSVAELLDAPRLVGVDVFSTQYRR